MESFWKGYEQILYIGGEIGDGPVIPPVYEPVACLTNTSFSESSDLLETTTRDNAGWKSAIPTNQGYAISFDGIAFDSRGLDLNPADPPPTKISWDRLKIVKRNRTRFFWELRIQGLNYVDFGTGYLVDLSADAPADGNSFITFSGTILGYGVAQQRSNYLPRVTWDSDIITFDDTLITFDSDN